MHVAGLLRKKSLANCTVLVRLLELPHHRNSPTLPYFPIQMYALPVSLLARLKQKIWSRARGWLREAGVVSDSSLS